MKSLLKRLSPFAPDQSGAVSALFEFGGMTVISDAGGCTGNVCGFDEPRWFRSKSAVFSAGLRDMDAILGRDDRLVANIVSAAEGGGFQFVAVIGTPVPAIIATDFRALKRMIESRSTLPALCVETTGTNLYDRGAESAYTSLFGTFASERFPVVKGAFGVLGATPLDFGRTDAGALLSAAFRARGCTDVRCYGMGADLNSVHRASETERNFVVAPAGLEAARLLERGFGTPWEIVCPYLPESLREKLRALSGRKILVLHQQFAADAARREILAAHPGVRADLGCFFMTVPELRRDGDSVLSGEEDLVETVARGGYDTIVGDAHLRRALSGFSGEFIDFPHFAVSGRLTEES